MVQVHILTNHIIMPKTKSKLRERPASALSLECGGHECGGQEMHPSPETGDAAACSHQDGMASLLLPECGGSQAGRVLRSSLKRSPASPAPHCLSDGFQKGGSYEVHWEGRTGGQ